MEVKIFLNRHQKQVMKNKTDEYIIHALMRLRIRNNTEYSSDMNDMNWIALSSVI